MSWAANSAMVERAVVNASPIILLSRVESLGLLRAVARAVYVPTAVAGEVNAKGGDDSVARALAEASWVQQVVADDVPAPVAAWNLGAGESAVLAVACSMPGSHAILDDREARRCAAAFRVSAFGTIGVVLRAKRLGALPEVRPILDRLVASGMFTTPELLRAAAASVGE